MQTQPLTIQNVDDTATSMLEIENEIRKSKLDMAMTKSTIIPRVKLFDALFLDTEVMEGGKKEKGGETGSEG